MALNKLLIFTTLTVALRGFLFGFDTAVISGANSALEKLFNLDKFWLGFTVAIALIGTMVVGKPADKYGRRHVLSYLAAFYAFSFLGCAFSFNWMSLLFFRFLGGIAVGGVSVVIPMYIAEIASAKFRGRSVRSKGLALGSFTWTMAAAVSWTFPVMAEKSGGYPFLFFAAMMLLQFFVMKFLYVETK